MVTMRAFSRAKAAESSLRMLTVRASPAARPLSRSAVCASAGRLATLPDVKMSAPMPMPVTAVLRWSSRDAHWSCSAARAGALTTLMVFAVRPVRISGTETCFGVTSPTTE
jgi:hypothetical protein